MNCPERISANSDNGWLGREPTVDEREVVAWLKRQPRCSRILHIGVGGCLLAQEFGNLVVQGLSRDGGEVEHARSIGLEVLLCNKYDIDSYRSSLRTPFDLIVDVNIRSYACCDHHFQQFMRTMHDALGPGGLLVTSMLGLEYRIPTTLEELQDYCRDWRIRKIDNVVVMTPKLPRFRTFLAAVLGRNRSG